MALANIPSLKDLSDSRNSNRDGIFWSNIKDHRHGPTCGGFELVDGLELLIERLTRKKEKKMMQIFIKNLLFLAR